MRGGRLAGILMAILIAAGCAPPPTGAPSEPPGAGPSRGTPGTVSDRGPGMKPVDLASLPLPVPRTVELTHVDPAAFAQALGKDLTRIFEFVRDHIAFEAYSGVLRGPRGTLLAMAGNSPDRAALLARLLIESGYQIRYVRGTLSEADARALIASMWAPLPPQAPPGVATEEARVAVEALVKSGKRDVERIRGALKAVSSSETQGAPTPGTLMQEAQRHVWVQVAQDGGWTDLDPTFADAMIGRTYTPAEETLPTLPASLYHRVTVRISAEVSDGTRSRVEELASYSTNAADLSGVGMLLVHVPENWQGPVRNIQGALSAALSDTGRIKPVLLISGQKPIIGAPFPIEVNTAGLGGIGGLLSGQGTRQPVELATAERIEFSFDYPDGHTEAVVRDVFDLVGQAKRGRGEGLTQEEISALATGDRTRVLKTTVLNLLVTTGRLDTAHVAGLPAEARRSPEGTAGGAGLLRRLAVAFVVASDALFERAPARDGTVVRFYPDSPRVFIDEFSAQGKEVRVAIDLRRDRVRVVAGVPNAPVIFGATVLRGAVEGTLERTLLEYAAAAVPRSLEIRPRVSTSLLFEQADARGIPALLVTSAQTPLDPAIPEDAWARLMADVSRGDVALAIQRPIDVAGVLRYAWWRINPRTGETIAVTDDGLHAASTEFVLVAEQEEGQYDAVLVTQTAVTPLATGLSDAAMQAFIRQLLQAGFRNIVVAAF